MAGDICARCEESEAAVSCMECTLKYCEECSTFRHKKGNFRNHVLSPLNVCDECELQSALTYCTDCDLVFCEKCSRDVHSKGSLQLHKMRSIQSNQPFSSKDDTDHSPVTTEENPAVSHIKNTHKSLRSKDDTDHSPVTTEENPAVWWVYNQENLTLQENFLTRQCFQDVILSCHAAVLLIKASHDYAPDHPVCLSMSGSDCCEDFFSQNGSFMMNKHTYSFGDMMQNQSNMNSILSMRASPSAPVIPKGHKKQENIWHKGHQQPAMKPNLQDWPTDNEIEKAWNEGLGNAQDKCRLLGMKPKVRRQVNVAAPGDDDDDDDDDDHKSCDKDDWFYRPHNVTPEEQRALLKLMSQETDNDPDKGPLTTHHDEQSDFDVGLAADLRQHLDDKNDKISTTIDVPGSGVIHKSTIMSQLNNAPDLPKDRLKRVQVRGPCTQQYDTESDVITDFRTTIGRHQDCAILVESSQQHTFLIGRVLRIRNKGVSGQIEYKMPVSLEESTKYTNVRFTLAMYQKKKKGYDYQATDIREYSIWAVIMGVKMQYRSSTKIYILDEVDRRELNSFVAKYSGPTFA